MKKYRIREIKFEDGISEFYPEYLGKTTTSKRSNINVDNIVNKNIEEYICLNSNGLPNNSYNDALGIIQEDIHKNSKIIEEKIHSLDDLPFVKRIKSSSENNKIIFTSKEEWLMEFLKWSEEDILKNRQIEKEYKNLKQNDKS